MPRSFITKDGFGITAACRRYLAPLIQGEDYPPYAQGLPSYVSLKNQRVARKLDERVCAKVARASPGGGGAWLEKQGLKPARICRRPSLAAEASLG